MVDFMQKTKTRTNGFLVRPGRKDEILQVAKLHLSALDHFWVPYKGKRRTNKTWRFIGAVFEIRNPSLELGLVLVRLLTNLSPWDTTVVFETQPNPK